MKNFDDLLAKDREFTVAGETFHWRDVRPEVLESFEPSSNGKEPESVWRVYDEQILLFLEPSEHERWKAVRAADDRPVTIRQIAAILTWLLEQQTGVPTVQPSPSDPGRGRTAATSKAG